MTWLILTTLFMAFVWGLRKFVFQTPPLIPQFIYGSLILSQLTYESIVKLDRWIRAQYVRRAEIQLFDQAQEWDFPEPTVEVWEDEQPHTTP